MMVTHHGRSNHNRLHVRCIRYGCAYDYGSVPFLQDVSMQGGILMPYKDPEKYKAYQTAYRELHREKLHEYSARRYHDDPENHKAKAAAWRRENKERKRDGDHKYYLANKDKILPRNALYRANNREKINAQHAAWYVKNREDQRVKKAAWRAEHPEEQRIRARQWRTANPEKALALKQHRRARKRNAPFNDFTATQWQTMKEHYGYRCVYCGKKQQRLTQDHITPLVCGGS